MARILPTTWNVDFALVDERAKNRLQKESNEFDALISKLLLGDDEMSIEYKSSTITFKSKGTRLQS
jgi:hypothetical protein